MTYKTLTEDCTEGFELFDKTLNSLCSAGWEPDGEMITAYQPVSSNIHRSGFKLTVFQRMKTEKQLKK